MKNWFVCIIVLACMMTIKTPRLAAQVSVTNDNSAPDASAMLDVKSANKGLLPPRVALTVLNSTQPVTAPATGLLVYNTATAGTPPNNVLPGYYCWIGTKWISVAVPQGTNVGDMLYWNGTQWVGVPIGLNGQVLTINNGIPVWANQCGISFTINHVAGAVAPVSKTVIYGTVTNVPGEPGKCWITGNLGADHQAISLSDNTEASAGWNWQFNRKQGYKHDGTTRTPNTSWITGITENSDWIAANDPCTLELGGGWRIPTNTEWTNVDGSGTWVNWNGPWSSGLKLHLGGFLHYADGSLVNRGTNGYYWSSTQSDASNSLNLTFNGSLCSMFGNFKGYAFNIRCIKDY